MENVILSIIVPVYNVQDYLIQCLESLINQTVKNYEIIAVNDGSTDGSLEILQNYAEKYSFLKVISQSNGGLSAARNTGIQYASGKYIGFIDSDDFAAKNFVEKMLERAEQDGSDLVVCDIEFYWEERNEKNYIMPGLNKKYDNLSASRKGILSPLFAWNKIYRKEFFLKQNIFFQPQTWYEDLEVTTYLFAKAEKVSYCNEVLIFYRQRENSIMSTRSSRCKEIFKVLERIYERFKENDLLPEYEEEICYLFIENLLLYGQYRFLVLDDYRDLNRQSRKMIKKYFPKYKRNLYLTDLNLKNKVFIYFNNSLTCPLFRLYLLRKSQ